MFPTCRFATRILRKTANARDAVARCLSGSFLEAPSVGWRLERNLAGLAVALSERPR